MRNFSTMAGDFGQHDDSMLINYICSRSLPRRGIKARPEQILVTLGAQNALYLIAHLLINPQKRVVIENPSYPDLRDILLQRTHEIMSLDVDAGGLVLDEQVLRQTDAVFITPSHQCPTTCTMPADRRLQLLDMAKRHDFLIVEDDYEFEMNFLESPTPALKSQDRDGRVIYVGSLSKSVFPGLRLGYMVAPEPVIKQARALRHLILRHPPAMPSAPWPILWRWGIMMRKSGGCAAILPNDGGFYKKPWIANHYCLKRRHILVALVFGCMGQNGWTHGIWQSLPWLKVC